MSTGLKANPDGSAAIQVGGTDVITLTSGGAATFVTSPTTVQAGTAAAPSITFSGDTNTGIYSPGADTIAFTEGGVESARFDSSGNFLINATTNSLNARVRIATATRTANFFDLTATGGENWVINSTNTTGSTDVLGIYANGATGLYIQDTGNVGIGTTSPVSRLAVNLANTAFSPSQTSAIGGSNATRAQFTAAEPGVMLSTDINGSGTQTGSPTVSMGMQIGLYNTNDIRNQIWWSGGYPLTFTYSGTPGASPTERARITSDGNLLVGKTSSNDNVVGAMIRGTGYFTSTWAETTNATTTYHVYSTGTGGYRFYVGLGGTVFAVSTTISAVSDQRLKENIQDLDVGLDAVMALKPRKFDWKEGQGKDIKGDRGFIAQEFETVFPDLIDEWRDPAPEGEEPYKSVRQDLIPVLVKAIQEQQAMIDELKAKVAALEGA